MKPIKLSVLAAAALLVSGTAFAQTLTIGFADPISSVDPQLNNHAGDRSLALHFWDSLVESRDGGKLLPALAESWQALDPTTWEFKLNPAIKWQDGTPVSAEDILFSFERARNVPGSVASYSGALRSVAAVESPDPHTVIVKTKAPSPNLPLEIASIYVVSKHVGEKSATEDYNSGKAVIGSGPYKFVSYVPGDRTIMERNPDYRGPTPHWERVNYRYINNGAARTAALLAGDVDVIDKVAVTDVTKLKNTPTVEVYTYPGLRVLLLQPSFRPGSNEFIKDNAGKPLPENPLLDVRVRQALSLAINRQAIVDRILQGTVTPANQWMPKDTFGFNPEIPEIPYDAAAAKQLLVDAGFPEGFQITIHVPGDRYPQAPETAQAVAQFWARIGVKTHVEVVPWSVYASRAGKNEFAVSVLAWGNGTGEAGYGLLQTLASNDPAQGRGISNWGRYSNAAVDKALDDANAEFDAERRAAIFQGAAKIVSDEVGQIPLFHYKNIWAAKKGLKVVPLLSDRTTALQVSPVTQQ
ncbi:ABC transporter substrate-binding protein [Kerstersia gyiorum]|uniref:ABC transporter substrate-binding protein n=1 Tax=Kerstersia gyiorum TaxID=206506 RepID=UPI00209F23A2|nr:ABC transporter substrate-binding protein [Kerstersia gyiorum]MCP1670839.1 peptide/nickel transport system substrate-binding protein [Kerstersia gyiorum]MCP1708819.1 peptide/nickel transport system substrate-binding protein [Kerstersia gyiorum]